MVTCSCSPGGTSCLSRKSVHIQKNMAVPLAVTTKVRTQAPITSPCLISLKTLGFRFHLRPSPACGSPWLVPPVFSVTISPTALPSSSPFPSSRSSVISAESTLISSPRPALPSYSAALAHRMPHARPPAPPAPPVQACTAASAEARAAAATRSRVQGQSSATLAIHRSTKLLKVFMSPVQPPTGMFSVPSHAGSHETFPRKKTESVLSSRPFTWSAHRGSLVCFHRQRLSAVFLGRGAGE